MSPEKDKKRLWRERKFLDMWSLVHLLGGFAIGGILLLLNIDTYIASAIAVALFAGWEIFEIVTKIHEHAFNRLSDMIVDYAGFFLAQLYVFAWGGTMTWYLTLAVAIVALALEAWGIIDFLNRKK